MARRATGQVDAEHALASGQLAQAFDRERVTATLASPAWADHPWMSLPHLTGTVRADICIVGLGGSGLTAVHEFLDRGFSVVGLDAGVIAGGAAGANGGFLLAGTARFYHATVASLGRGRARELYQRTLQEIDRMEREMPDLVERRGSLRIAMSEEELVDCERQFEAMEVDALPVRRYQGAEGQGLLIPTDGAFHPLRRCRRLAETALQRGARLFENSPALEIHGESVRSEQGIVRCRCAIVAVDGRLDAILPELSREIRTARLQMLGTAPIADQRYERPVYARYGFEYWQQLNDGRIVLGGFRDHALEEEWTQSTSTTVAIQSLLENFLRATLRIDAPITHRWAASVGYTSTALPIVREVRRNVWAVGGYNGTGNVVGALCARGVAERIANGKSEILKLLTDA